MRLLEISQILQSLSSDLTAVSITTIERGDGEDVDVLNERAFVCIDRCLL